MNFDGYRRADGKTGTKTRTGHPQRGLLTRRRPDNSAWSQKRRLSSQYSGVRSDGEDRAPVKKTSTARLYPNILAY